MVEIIILLDARMLEGGDVKIVGISLQKRRRIIEKSYGGIVRKIGKICRKKLRRIARKLEKNLEILKPHFCEDFKKNMKQF